MAVSRINEAGLNINQYGNRNMFINGGMDVCQRSTSETGLGASETYFVQDRFKLSLGAASAGRLTATQETTDVPNGFKSAMKLACTTADTSIAAGEYMAVNQHIEADICVRTETGTSSAKQITLSFYAKANANATYVVQILNNKHSSYIHNNRTFNVTTSYQRFSITFQADTTADSKFDGDLTAAGFSVSWILHAGSNFTSATLASDWATGTTNRAAGTDSFFSSTSNTFFLTGVQLEVGDTATDFEHRTFDDELNKCHRYFQRVEYKSGSMEVGLQSTTDNGVWNLKYFPKRADPTITLPTPAVASGANVISVLTSAGSYRSSSGSEAVSADRISKDNTRVILSGFSSSGSVGDATWIYFVTNTSTKPHILIDAEL